ncbi:MAG: SpoIIE family protein phosphatase, partial [Spirochaetaceae bacterium]|nr:SpoIIE family protein phosphatase [Spirochaetaceae bacterium]
LRRLNADYTRLMEEELKWAAEMQRTILRPDIPSTDRIEFSVSYKPVPGVYCGGDYFDVIFLGKDRYFFLIGDVQGHGVRAAFATGILKAIIYPEYVRPMIGKEISPGAFLGWLNGRLNFEFRRSAGMRVTFFAGIADLNSASFRYANAGHDRPFIVKGGKPVELQAQGPAIGSANSLSFADETASLSSGDVIVMYTEGLGETAKGAHSSSLKIGSILARVGYAKDYHSRIADAILAETGSKHFTNDVTIVSAKIV